MEQKDLEEEGKLVLRDWGPLVGRTCCTKNKWLAFDGRRRVPHRTLRFNFCGESGGRAFAALYVRSLEPSNDGAPPFPSKKSGSAQADLNYPGGTSSKRQNKDGAKEEPNDIMDCVTELTTNGHKSDTDGGASIRRAMHAAVKHGRCMRLFE